MKLIWAVLFTGLSLVKAQLVGPASCKTPNDFWGICMDLRQCTILMNAIRSQRQESYDFVRASQCDTSKDIPNPKVCCGSHDNYINQEYTPVKSPFPIQCGNSSATSTRIYGGIEAELGTFPWMARLRHRRNDSLLSYGCVGFLISNKFVLTAAHCIKSKALAELGPIYQVQLGEHNTETDPDCTEDTSRWCADSPQYLKTADPIVHPYYSNDEEHHHDIAIIPLLETATITRFVTPICLPRTPTTARYFWLSGWGKTESSDNSNVKLQVIVPKADRNLCSSLYKLNEVRILDYQFCAGGIKGKDSCIGDSGGPIMGVRNMVWYAEGIVSMGLGCGNEGLPVVYTNLPKYFDWIKLVATKYLKQEKMKA